MNSPLPLDAPDWTSLHHVYGEASDIPELLRQLETAPSQPVRDWNGPWNLLWAALCHGGLDVGTASYAATPHLLRIGKTADPDVVWGYLLLIASIETSRLDGLGPAVPDHLSHAYTETLYAASEWALQMIRSPWDFLLCGSVLAVVAAAKGQADLAHVLINCSPDNVALLRKVIDRGEDLAGIEEDE